MPSDSVNPRHKSEDFHFALNGQLCDCIISAVSTLFEWEIIERFEQITSAIWSVEKGRPRIDGREPNFLEVGVDEAACINHQQIVNDARISFEHPSNSTNVQPKEDPRIQKSQILLNGTIWVQAIPQTNFVERLLIADRRFAMDWVENLAACRTVLTLDRESIPGLDLEQIQ